MTHGEDLQLTGLSWLRAIARRGGAWLALLALVVQIAASFGHVHARDFAADDGSRDAPGWHKTIATQAAISNADTRGGEEDQCPICFSAFLLAASFVPQGEQPATVRDCGDAGYISGSAGFGLLESGRAPFQSRAPPSV